MSDIILHHYPQSPVSEKVRVVLGIKGLAWRSVEIPRLPPRPDQMPLTGGYRLTPVMQIGADIYCDSQSINRELDRRFPTPTLFPGGADGMAWGVGQWTDGPLFMACIQVVFADGAETMPVDFLNDRGAIYFGRDFDASRLPAGLKSGLARLRAQFGWMNARLATGRKFMLGDAPGLPDALCYYLVWMIRGRYSDGPGFLSQFPALNAWEQRVAAIGHGMPTEMTAIEALEVARNATPDDASEIDPDDPEDLHAGDSVEVVSESVEDSKPVSGRLVGLGRDDIVIQRDDDRVGRVAVHFPRVGYAVRRA